MRNRIAILLAASFLLSLLGSWAPAEGASILSLLNIFPQKDGLNAASDEDREYLIDRFGDPETGVKTTGQIDVGDSLRFMFNINTINGSQANVGGLTGNDEWTGVGQLLVASKESKGGGLYLYNFVPDPTFAEGGGTKGAMIVFSTSSTINAAMDWDDATAGPIVGMFGPNGTDDGTPAQPALPGFPGRLENPPSNKDVSVGPYSAEEAFIATATDGSRFWTVGFTGADTSVNGMASVLPNGAGEGWQALTFGGFDNILAAFNVPNGTAGSLVNAGLSVLDGPGTEVGDVLTLGATSSLWGSADLVGTSNVKGVKDLDTPFETSSDFTFSFKVDAIVPEPASILVWTGLLLGLGVGLIRRGRD